MSRPKTPLPFPDLLASSAQRAHWLPRLLDSIWHLGRKNGYRYWKLQQRAIETPDLLEHWAFGCRVEANQAEATGNTLWAATLRAWADELERRHRSREPADTAKLTC